MSGWNSQGWTRCNKLVITPSRELQIQLCKLHWKVSLIIFPIVYSLHINSGSINLFQIYPFCIWPKLFIWMSNNLNNATIPYLLSKPNSSCLASWIAFSVHIFLINPFKTTCMFLALPLVIRSQWMCKWSLETLMVFLWWFLSSTCLSHCQPCAFNCNMYLSMWAFLANNYLLTLDFQFKTNK